MNIHTQQDNKSKKTEAPLFASPWLALFFVLRREFAQPRQSI